MVKFCASKPYFLMLGHIYVYASMLRVHDISNTQPAKDLGAQDLDR